MTSLYKEMEKLEPQKLLRRAWTQNQVGEEEERAKLE